MKAHECPFAVQVRAALGTDHWDADLKLHVERCPACADMVRVVRALQAMKASEPAESLPDPHQIFWQARYFAPLELEKRALRPLSAARAFTLFTMALAGLALFLGYGQRLYAGFVQAFDQPLRWLDTLLLASMPLRPSLLIFWGTATVLVGVFVLLIAEYAFAD